MKSIYRADASFSIRLTVICLLLPAGLIAQTEIGSSPIWYEGSNVGIGTEGLRFFV